MTKINIGTNDDGTARYHYHHPGKHVVYIGRAIQGTVDVNGKPVDLSEDVIVADSPEHAAAIAHAVGEHLAANGHPTDPNYTYEPPKGKK